MLRRQSDMDVLSAITHFVFRFLPCVCRYDSHDKSLGSLRMPDSAGRPEHPPIAMQTFPWLASSFLLLLLLCFVFAIDLRMPNAFSIPYIKSQLLLPGLYFYDPIVANTV